jgi:membrane protein
MADQHRDVVTVDRPVEQDSGEQQRGGTASSPSDIPARGWKDVLIRVKNEVKDDHTVLAAAGVAFFGFLALIPALAALVSILGLVTSPDQAASRAEDLFGGLPQEAQNLLSEQLDSLSQQSSSSLTIALVGSIVLALWSASSGMSHLIEGINVAYDEHDNRNFFVKKGLSLGLTLGAIVFLVAAAVGLAALPGILDSLGTPGWVSWMVRIAFWPILAIGFVVGLSILYRTAPDRSDPRWQWVTWGSGIALVLWIVASIGFRIYTSTFGSYNESYGSLAAVVILLMWLFITSFVILLGAQINSELEHQTAADTTTGGDQPIGSRDAVAADTVASSGDNDNTADSGRG